MYRKLKTSIARSGTRPQKRRFNYCLSRRMPWTSRVQKYILSGGMLPGLSFDGLESSEDESALPADVQPKPLASLGALDLDLSDEEIPTAKRRRVSPEELIIEPDKLLGNIFTKKKMKKGKDFIVMFSDNDEWVIKGAKDHVDVAKLSRMISIQSELFETGIPVPQLHDVHKDGIILKTGKMYYIVEQNVSSETFLDKWNDALERNDKHRQKYLLNEVLKLLKLLRTNDIVHNDFRPENLVVTDAGNLFLIDLMTVSIPGNQASIGALAFKNNYSDRLNIADKGDDIYQSVPFDMPYTDARTFCLLTAPPYKSKGKMVNPLKVDTTNDSYKMLKTLWDSTLAPPFTLPESLES